MHDRDAIRDIERHAELLLDEQDRDLSLARELADHVLDLLHDDRRQSFGRLVHDEQPWIADQRPADRQHLLLAAGELRAAGSAALARAAGRCRRRARASIRRSRPCGWRAAGARRPSARASNAVPAARSRRRGARSGAAAGRRCPRRRRVMAPPVGRTSPVTVLHSVDLPMPLRPTTATTPRSSFRFRPCSTGTRP